MPVDDCEMADAEPATPCRLLDLPDELKLQISGYVSTKHSV
jgi:hypothetical protein